MAESTKGQPRDKDGIVTDNYYDRTADGYEVEEGRYGGKFVEQLPLVPLGFQQLSVSNTAVALTVPTGGNVTVAIIYVETAAIRWRDDGTSPTASVGMIALPDSILHLENLGNLAAIKFIRRDGTNATLNISYYGVST